ncbi:MAG TPA: DMT family transporter [Solirubrobacterales bacterium]|nr:DMT family transporter [Solirubrobacterales bacterium]
MSARAWFAFGAVSVLWGIPYFFIKVAVDDGVPPAFLAWVRVTLAAAILIALSWRLGLLGSLRGRGRVLAIYAVAEIVIPFPLIAAGEQHVSSSLAAILIATVPLIVAVLALRFDHAERAAGSRLVGLFVGFAGVVALVGIDIAGESDELLGAGAILLAAVGYAIGPMVLKRRLADLDPRALMGGALAIAALALTPAALAAPPDEAVPAEAVISLIVLGVLCTAAAFVFFGALIAEVGPSRASVITYVAPAVAVVLGVAVLDESLGPGAIAGLALILAGSWLSTGGRLPPGGLGAIAARRGGGRRELEQLPGERRGGVGAEAEARDPAEAVVDDGHGDVLAVASEDQLFPRPGLDRGHGPPPPAAGGGY